jgi:predicted nucleotide-binding protein
MANSGRKKTMLSSPHNEVEKKLEECIREGEQILTAPIRDSREFKLAKEAEDLWYDYTKDLLSSLFNTDDIRQEFVQTVSSWGLHLSFQEQVSEFREHLDRRISKLRSIIRRLTLFEEEPRKGMVTQIEETKSISKKTVFVVHGRDENLRKSMFDFLRSIGLDPLEWSHTIVATKKSSPYIGDILDAAFGLAQAVVVLISGDDEARLLPEFMQGNDPDYEKELTLQPRPNVLFEAGMATGRSQERTVLVEVGKLRPWSDVAGRHITHLDDSPQKRHELAIKLRNAGCDIDLDGQDWMTAGDFEGVRGSIRHRKQIETNPVEEASLQAYCVKCRLKRDIKDAKLITTVNGRTGIMGFCPICGTKLFRLGPI